MKLCVLSAFLAMPVVCAAQSPLAHLIVANKTDATIGLIDPAKGTQIAAVPEDGFTVHELTVLPDGRTAFAPVYGDSGVGRAGTDGRFIDIIDLTQPKLIGKIDFGRGIRPHFPVFDPNSGMLYVTTELDESVSIIDPKTRRIVGRIPTTQPQSHMLTISHDGRFGYTANVGPGTVSVLDLKARAFVSLIKISNNTQRISISADDKWVFTADQTKPQLAVIDTASRSVARWIPVPVVAYGTAATPDGRWLLVTQPSTNKLAIVDLKTFTVARTIDVATDPQEVIVRPDGQEAYVSCRGSNQVAAVNLKDFTVRRIDAGKGVDGLAWAP